MKRNKPAAGLPEWLRLFDTGERDHVCYLLEQRMLPGRPPRDDGLSVGIEDHLCESLRAYVRDAETQGRGSTIDVEAANALLTAAGRIIGLLRGRKPANGSKVSSDLDVAWTRFIAAGAGHRMYDDLPKEHAARRSLVRTAVNARKLKADERASKITAAFDSYIASGSDLRHAKSCVYAKWAKREGGPTDRLSQRQVSAILARYIKEKKK